MSVLTNVELVMWSPCEGAEPPLVTQVRDALVARNFSADHAAEIPESTVFRRAVKAQEGKRDDGSETRATVWARDGKTFAQLDLLTPEGERMRRERVAGWSLNGEVTGSYALPLAEHAARYTWADLSTIVQRIFRQDGLGAYTPRKAGGIYFVPVQSRDLLDALESACRSIGLNLLRYQIPDTQAQRTEIASAIVAHLEGELAAHEQAIAEYRPESTRAGVVENRKEALRVTAMLIARLSMYLDDDSRARLVRVCQLLQQRCDAMIEAIHSHRPVPQGRRIVTQEVPNG